MKKINLAPLRWLTFSQIWRERLEDLLKSKAGERELLDEQFISRIQKRREDLERMFWKVGITNTVLIVALFLNAVVLQAEISIAGLSPRQLGAMKELVLFVSATLTAVGLILAMNRQALKMTAIAIAEKKHSPELRDIGRLAFGDAFGDLPSLVPPPGRQRQGTWFVALLYVGFLILATIWIAAWGLSILFVYSVVIFDAFTAPSLPLLWSRLIVTYAAAVYLMSVLVHLILYVPLPYRDYSLVAELTALQKYSREAYEDRIRELRAELRRT